MLSDMARYVLDDARDVEDPYSVYRQLRERGPVCRGGPGQWVFTRHAEVSALLRDPRLGREYPEQYQAMSIGDGPANDYLQRIVINRDGHDHTRLRRLLTKSLNPAMVRSLARPIGTFVDRTLDQLADRDVWDLVTDLAVPVPMSVMSELFEIPAADRDAIARWSTSLAQTFAVFIPDERRHEAHEAVIRLRAYFADLLRERRRRPGDDLLSRMLTAVRGGTEPLTDEEIVDNALFVYYAGLETTINMIATGGNALIAQPDAQHQLRADPSIVATALDEFMRYDAPIHTTSRLALEPIEIAGHTVRRGRVVVLLLASANRDESVFENPDRMNLTRSPNPHVSFGGGVHHCLGAALARVEGAVVFERLMARFSRLESAGPVHWNPSSGGFRFPYWVFEKIPVTARPT